MFGYFQNAGSTRRQGIEAKINYKWDRITAYANYTYVDATYLSPLVISSPNNPSADANGNIFVSPGDHIPAIPAQRFKAGRGIRRRGLLEVRRRPQRHRQPVSDPRRCQPEPQGAGLTRSSICTPPIEVNEECRAVRPGEQSVQPALLFGRHVLQRLRVQQQHLRSAQFSVFSDPRTFLPGMPLACTPACARNSNPSPAPLPIVRTIGEAHELRPPMHGKPQYHEVSRNCRRVLGERPTSPEFSKVNGIGSLRCPPRRRRSAP